MTLQTKLNPLITAPWSL